MMDCSAGNQLTWTSSLDYQGMVLLGLYGWSDVFVVNFETSFMGYGISIIGNGNTSSTYDYLNEDVRIINPVLDTCGIAGISFTNISLYGAIQVSTGYIAFNPTASSPVGIQYSSSNGSISVSQVQVMGQQNTTAIAVAGTSSKGIMHKNNVLFEFTTTMMQLIGVSESRFEDQIRNFSIGSGAVPAVAMSSGCTRDVIDMTISGKASGFSQGIYLSDNTTTYTEFKMSGVNPACIANAKLNNNGTAITSAGAFGTGNLASGIMN
jgi:hypothetical protein